MVSAFFTSLCLRASLKNLDKICTPSEFAMVRSTMGIEVFSTEKEKREADLKADQNKIETLEKQLGEAEKVRANYESMENLKQLERLEQDKIRFRNLINSERIRKEQDSIKFINTFKKFI